MYVHFLKIYTYSYNIYIESLEVKNDKSILSQKYS